MTRNARDIPTSETSSADLAQWVNEAFAAHREQCGCGDPSETDDCRIESDFRLLRVLEALVDLNRLKAETLVREARSNKAALKRGLKKVVHPLWEKPRS